MPFLHRHCLKASGPARAVGGRHLPRLRIKCVLFLGGGEEGPMVHGKYLGAVLPRAAFLAKSVLMGERLRWLQVVNWEG